MQLQSNKIFKRFIQDEAGGMTYFALIVFVIVVMFSGISLDSTSAWRTRTMLQTAADATAYAAIQALEEAGNASVDNNGKNSIWNQVSDLVDANLDAASKSSAITSSSLTYGSWDSDTATFTETNDGVDAIRVLATRSTENDNPLPTFLMGFSGLQSWNIQVESIAVFDDECSVADIASGGVFEITSNNNVYGEYCIYGEDGIKLSSNNFYSDDTVLSVNSFDDITWPGSVGMDSVIGRGTSESASDLTYEDIFTETTPDGPNVPNISTMASSYLDPYYVNIPDYINTSASVITISANQVKYTDFIEGRIYEVECGGSHGTKAQFFRNSDVREVVIVADCKMQLGNNSTFEDVVLVSTYSGSKSVYGANSVRLGQDDNCAAGGGGVDIYTAGDFSSAANMEVYGTNIFVGGEVHIAAKTNGVGGLVLHALGDIKLTSQASLGACIESGAISSVETAYRIAK
jgi:Flp pilus assembly protein TadG